MANPSIAYDPMYPGIYGERDYFIIIIIIIRTDNVNNKIKKKFRQKTRFPPK